MELALKVHTVNEATVARIAGNIAAGLIPAGLNIDDPEAIARLSVQIARAIRREVEEPSDGDVAP